MLTEKQLRNYWRKVDVQGEDECWNWVACLNKSGYGNFGVSNPSRVCLSHRVMAYIKGMIPNVNVVNSNDQVLHTCDNRKCQNPKHFFIGSNKDNVADRMSKKRSSSKLTVDQVINIKKLYTSKKMTQSNIADQFSISQTMVSHIMLRKAWAYL